MKTLFAAFTSVCVVATLTYASPPPVTVAQPVDVKVVNPVTVTGKVDIGNKVEISGTVETLNDALKIPFHLTVKQTNSSHGTLYTVPVGMRLTIESVTSLIQVPNGQKALAILSPTSEQSENQRTLDYLALQPQCSFGTYDLFVSSQNLRIIVDSTSPKLEYLIVQEGIGYSYVVLTINGYLEAVP
jgi:hypothetical protein